MQSLAELLQVWARLTENLFFLVLQYFMFEANTMLRPLPSIPDKVVLCKECPLQTNCPPNKVVLG